MKCKAAQERDVWPPALGESPAHRRGCGAEREKGGSCLLSYHPGG